MKKILLSLAAVAALGAAAAPAAAQPRPGYDHPGYDHPTATEMARVPAHQVSHRLKPAYVDGLQMQVRQAFAAGRISRQEARDLRRDLRDVTPIAWRVQSGEARRFEAERLDRVVTRV